MNQPLCKSGVICEHEGPCTKDCGGDHYFHTDGTCLRCGKFEHDRASGEALVSKGRKLKLWNGRWGNSGHVYIAAYSQQDACNLAVAAGSNPRGLMGEIQHYWSSGAWGTAITGIEPERGIWISKASNDTPVRKCLEERKATERPQPASSPPPMSQLSAKLKLERNAREAKARNWREALVEQIKDQKELIERLDFPPNGEFHGPHLMSNIRAERLELLEKLLEFEATPAESSEYPPA
jgi:hypothetical protein